MRRAVSLVTAISLIAAVPAPPVSGQAAPKSTAKPSDGGWPRRYTAPRGDIALYQPQILSWESERALVAYAAVSYQQQGVDKPALGTIKLEADTSVSLDERLVNLSRLRITESHFPSLQKEQTRVIVDELAKAIPAQNPVIALDRVLANMNASQIRPKNVDGIKADPPVIFFSTTPAVVMNIDGDPVWSPIKENDLKFAVNTNWDLFHHVPTNVFYLRNDSSWLQAAAVTGPWTPAVKLPESFAKLPADANFKDVKAAVPGKPIAAGQAPTVFVSTKPAELILMRGAPTYLPIEGTGLLWVNNSEADVFRLGKTGPIYYLVTGRWFSAADFTGPWTFATPKLPEDFRKIPLEFERSRVLASVPGTQQAAEAVLLAQVPQKARVNKTQVKAPDVIYQGNADFKPIEGTSLQRAVNTDKDIIKSGDAYYMCYEAVWFTAKSPNGPWQVATIVPPEIYKIPASSPVHNVTYVVVEDDDDDDEWVTFAYMAGYTGMMVAWGCAVWGSGWYYPPYIGYGGFYPVYYPYFPTYGYSAFYNPWTGTYGRSAVAYGPYGGLGATARYNPRTGTYARSAVAWGPYGARGAAQAWNPRTGAYGQTRQGSNIYGSWGSTSVQRGDDWAQTGRVTNRVTGNTTRVTRTDEGGAVSRRGPGGGGFVAGSDEGNIYAGHDGNVYRRENGSWQKYENGNWGDAARPETRASGDGARAGDSRIDSSTSGQLERDRGARAEGQQRMRDQQTYRSGASRGSMGSYRARGGGGGRRR